MGDDMIGVVTVTYNSAAFLDDFLLSADRQDHADWHGFIIDNDSADDTLAALRSKNLDPSRYSIVPNQRNVGVAAGNNQGILLSLKSGCDWVLLINNDTSYPPQLFSNLLRVAKERGWRAVVPKIHFNVPANTIWYGGGGFDEKKGHTGYHTGISETDAGQYDRQKTVGYAPTCCMLIHRSVFEEVGLMDESYFAYFDDTDFCWRLKQAGIPLGYAPEAVVIHKVGGSSGGTESAFYAYMTARNRLYFLRKHFGPTAPLRWLAVFLPFYVFRYLIKRWNPSAFRAAIKGTWEYRKMQKHAPALEGSQRSTSSAGASLR